MLNAHDKDTPTRRHKHPRTGVVRGSKNIRARQGAGRSPSALIYTLSHPPLPSPTATLTPTSPFAACAASPRGCIHAARRPILGARSVAAPVDGAAAGAPPRQALGNPRGCGARHRSHSCGCWVCGRDSSQTLACCLALLFPLPCRLFTSSSPALPFANASLPSPMCTCFPPHNHRCALYYSIRFVHALALVPCSLPSPLPTHQFSPSTQDTGSCV